MRDKKFLHLYLKESPDEAEIHTLLEFYGFTLREFHDRDGTREPNEFHWEWKHPPLSGSGFTLVYFDALFPDDLSFEDYGSFAILEAVRESSTIDVAYLDVAAKFLLDRYGGTIRNPNDIEAPAFLCGQSFAA